jgi:hypothetical protein
MMGLGQITSGFSDGGVKNNDVSVGGDGGNIENLMSGAAQEFNTAQADAAPYLFHFEDSNKQLDSILEKSLSIEKAMERIKKFNEAQASIRKLRKQAWEYGAEDLGLDIYGRDKKRWDAMYLAYQDISDPKGPMQDKTRQLRKMKAEAREIGDVQTENRLEGEIQSVEKYYTDRYDKLRKKMIKPARVRLLDYKNRYLERMDTLKIQGFVKQIVNRLDYTNAHVDARVLREMNKDQGFITLVRNGDFQGAADAFQEAVDCARNGQVAPDSNPLGSGLRAQITAWGDENSEQYKPDFLKNIESIVRNYRQFVGNPKGTTRGGDWNSARNAVAVMLQIEIIKEVSGRLEKYAGMEGQDEQAYRRNIDNFVKKMELYEGQQNFQKFFNREFGNPPVKCNDPEKGFIAVIKRKRDGTNPNDDEKSRLDEQIRFLQAYDGPEDNLDTPAGAKRAKMSNTDINIGRQMAQVSYDIDVANEKSDHQDFANEEIRKMMKDFYIPMKKLEQFKGSSGQEK